MKQNGKQKRQLASFGTWPDFSPDGSKVVFSGAPSGSTNMDIWLVDVDGGNLTQLTTARWTDQFLPGHPTAAGSSSAASAPASPRSVVMNADGSDQTQLTFDLIPKGSAPRLEPGRVADRIRRADAPGRRRHLGYECQRQQPPAGDIGADKLGTAWSPDGTEIATLDWPSRTVEIMNADGTDVHAVRPGGIQFVPGWQPRDTGWTTTGDATLNRRLKLLAVL